MITGATGPLGIALIKILLERRIAVTAIVRKGSARLSRLPKDPLLKLVYSDISSLSEVDIKEKIDAFFHFAWTNTANRTERGDNAAQSANVSYSVDAVDLARRTGCRVFIGAGSQSEYGEFEGIIDLHTPTNPTEAYGVAKLAAMRQCQQKCNEHGIRFGWLRILSLYGPHDRESTFISYCIKELQNGRSPKLTKCEQIWDYTYSKDAARAFWLLAEKGKEDAVCPLASGEARPLRERAETIRNIVAPQVDIEFGALAYPPGQRFFLAANTGPLREATGFSPEYSFEKGIEEMTGGVR
jgi:nucleoside-diphosphate-sugar epimerase